MKRFPLVHQFDSSQCGIACISMVCRHYGRKYSLDFLESLSSGSKNGMSVKNLSELATSLGLDCVCGKVAVEQLQSCTYPVILHWNSNHFVVLYKTSKQKFFIADPAKGRLKLTYSEFEKKFISASSASVPGKGIAIFLIPTEEFGNKNDDITKAEIGYKLILKLLKNNKALFGHILTGMVLGAGCQLIFPFMTQAIVDVGIYNSSINIIWLILIGELVLVVARVFTDLIRDWLLLHISMRVSISIISDFFIKLMRLPMRFFDTRNIGDLFQRIGDHERVRDFLTNQILRILFAIISFSIFGIVLSIYSPTVFGIFITGSVIYGIWISLFLQKRGKLDTIIFS